MRDGGCAHFMTLRLFLSAFYIFAPRIMRASRKMFIPNVIRRVRLSDSCLRFSTSSNGRNSSSPLYLKDPSSFSRLYFFLITWSLIIRAIMRDIIGESTMTSESQPLFLLKKRENAMAKRSSPAAIRIVFTVALSIFFMAFVFNEPQCESNDFSP